MAASSGPAGGEEAGGARGELLGHLPPGVATRAGGDSPRNTQSCIPQGRVSSLLSRPSRKWPWGRMKVFQCQALGALWKVQKLL